MLQRLALEEPMQLWSSTDVELVVEALFRRHDQLSTVVTRPPVTQPYDVAIQIHESAIGNALATVLAGRTLSEQRLEELLDKAGLQSEGDESSEAADDEPPFEIDFARLRPIIFEAREQTIRLGVRGTRFAQGNRELKRAMEITALYEPMKTDLGNTLLMRKGDVGVDFPGGRRLTMAQAGLRRTIEKKFSGVFPETLLSQALVLPSDAEVESLRNREFHARGIDAQDGWITVVAQ
jgi:hypothetical protein